MLFNYIVAYSIPKALRDTLEKDDKYYTPSCTKYKIRCFTEGNNNPSWSMGQPSKKKKPISFGPGIGKYTLNTFIGEGPKYSFRDKLREESAKGKRAQGEVIKETPVPGPGSYSVTEPNEGPKWTFREKLKDNKKKTKYKILQEKKGEVGDYEVRNDNLLFAHKSYSFGKVERGDSAKRRIKKEDGRGGPGSYKVDTSLLGTRTPSYSFSKERRIDILPTRNQIIRQKEPGPDKYKVQEFVGHEGLRFTFPREKKFNVYNQEKNVNPSPGQYYGHEKGYKSEAFCYSFPTLPRRDYSLNIVNMSFPCPTKYNVSQSFISTVAQSPKWGFGTSNREGKRYDRTYSYKNMDDMGPGRYTFTNGFIPQGTQFSFRPRIKKKLKSGFPSPTRYNANNPSKGKEPCYTFPSAPKGNELDQTIKDNYPGPGKYQINDSKTSFSFSFPSSRKEFLEKHKDPKGPGYYRIPCRFNDISDETRRRGFYNPIFRYV